MKVAWYRKPEDEEWQEALLTEDEALIPEATKWAEAQGWTVRVADIALTVPPQFGANVLNTRRPRRR